MRTGTEYLIVLSEILARTRHCPAAAALERGAGPCAWLGAKLSSRHWRTWIPRFPVRRTPCAKLRAIWGIPMPNELNLLRHSPAHRPAGHSSSTVQVPAPGGSGCLLTAKSLFSLWIGVTKQFLPETAARLRSQPHSRAFIPPANLTTTPPSPPTIVIIHTPQWCRADAVQNRQLHHEREEIGSRPQPLFS